MATSGGDSWRRDVRPGVFAIVFGVIVIALSVLIVSVILWPQLGGLDSEVSALVRSLRTPGLTRLAVAVTHIADTWSLVILVPIAAILLYFSGRRSEAVFVIVVVAGGRLLGVLIQVLVHRSRPAGVNLVPLPPQHSFPSGHALAAILFFGALSFIVLGEVRRPWLRYGLIALFAVVSVAVGMSRVYLGVHWFGDVVGAWLFGAAVLLVAVLGFFALTQPRAD